MDKSIPVRGKILGKLRRAAYFSQAELAQQIGLSTGRLASIEQSDRGGMLIKNFRKLAEVLKVDPQELQKILATGRVEIELPRFVRIELGPADYARLKQFAGERAVAEVARVLVLAGLPPVDLDKQADVVHVGPVPRPADFKRGRAQAGEGATPAGHSAGRGPGQQGARAPDAAVTP